MVSVSRTISGKKGASIDDARDTRYISRLARGPDIIWDRKNNPTPWNNVEPGTNTKMMAVNQKFDKQYKRDRL